jgi:hypothetical protein
MDRNSFFVYSGQVQEVPCTVADYVFSNLNMAQRYKIHAAHNHNFQEVIWFYPSAGSPEVDRYVLFNYVDNTWSIGTLRRTAWLDLVWADSYPIATADGYIYHHEIGDDADGEALPAWIQSSDTDLEDGEHFLFVRRLVPDVNFRGAGSAQSVGVTLLSRRSPGGFYDTSARAEVTPYTEVCYMRTRGRQFALRVESETVGTGWRLGAFRVDVRPDGRR